MDVEGKYGGWEISQDLSKLENLGHITESENKTSKIGKFSNFQ